MIEPNSYKFIIVRTHFRHTVHNGTIEPVESNNTMSRILSVKRKRNSIKLGYMTYGFQTSTKITADDERFADKIDYDLCKFRNYYRKIKPKQIRDLETFVDALHERIKIECADSDFRLVTHGVNVVLGEMRKWIPKLEKFDMKPSGSLFAGLRVGRPYEADILLVAHESDSDDVTEEAALSAGQLYSEIKATLPDVNQSIAQSGWIIHAI